MSRKREAPKTCSECGTKLPANGRCVKWNRCEPFRRDHESLMQRIKAIDEAKRVKK